MQFSDMGLSPHLLKAIVEQEYQVPTPIQAKAIPAVLKGIDVMAAAKTGTGKTASFTLPLLQKLSAGKRVQANQARSLILTPTRELAAQVNQSISLYGKYASLSSMVVVGGVKINPQMMRLRQGTDILVATPGRLLDLHNQNAVSFKQLEVIVLDEADRMLDMGFIHDIRKIFSFLPNQRQTLMFSATFSKDIRTLAKTLLNNPIEVSLNPKNTTVDEIKQWICPVDKKQKSKLLLSLIVSNKWQQVLVFCRTKHGANRLTRFLEERGLNAVAIHGNKSQSARTKALAKFKSGDTQILVATDIAARGLDIDQLPHVVNFDLPHVPEDYVHRVGRTGRAGAKGEAISLVSADEVKQLNDIECLIKQTLTREIMEGFEPIHDLPQTNLSSKMPHRKNTTKKKPQQPSSRHAHHDHDKKGHRRKKVQSKSRHANKIQSKGRRTSKIN